MTSKDVPRQPGIASSILVGGALIYGLLCLPAIGQRGYPRIDPAWVGVTLLWISPIALSALFDSFRFRARRNYLIAYALGTAFMFSGTLVMSVPKYFNPAEMLLGTVLFFGPMHLAIGFAVEGFMQLCLWPVRRFIEPVAGTEDYEFPQVDLRTWLMTYAIVCMTIGFPFAFRSLAIRLERNKGAACALEDWNSEKSVIYSEPTWQLDVQNLEYHFDPTTGFKRESRLHDFGFRDAYNAKTAELIDRYGSPSWSMKLYIPEPKLLISQLDANDMQLVESFPYEVTPSIVLMRRGELSRWGSTMSNGDDNLAIATELGAIIGVGDSVKPVAIRIEGDVIFIRDGSDWVGAFHKSGRFLGSASRH